MKKLLVLATLVGGMLISTQAMARSGVYNLDKASFMKMMEAEMMARFGKHPKSEARMKMAMAMFKSLQMNLTLFKNHRARMTTKMSFFGRTRTTLATGTWNAKGNVLEVETTSKGRRKRKQNIRCTLKKKAISCINTKGKKKRELRFNRVANAPAYKPLPKPKKRMAPGGKLKMKAPTARPKAAPSKEPATRPEPRK